MKKISFYFSFVICSLFVSKAYAQPCVDPNQIDLDVMCIQVYDPVCGCDGVTYTNSCHAINYGGVTSYTPGPCCVDQNQIDMDVVCTQVYDPVCGCNGVTYTNSCYATNYGGVTSFTAGPCSTTPTEECSDLNGIDFGQCLAILGYGVMNGSCNVISGCGEVVNNIDYSPAIYPTIEECQACLNSEVQTLNELYIQLYPNPAGEQINILLDEVASIDYSIIDLYGRTLSSGSLTEGLNSISLIEIGSGNYLIIFSKDDKKIVRTLQKL